MVENATCSKCTVRQKWDPSSSGKTTFNSSKTSISGLESSNRTSLSKAQMASLFQTRATSSRSATRTAKLFQLEKSARFLSSLPILWWATSALWVNSFIYKFARFLEPDQGEWYAMGDEAYLTEDNHVVVLGRLKEQITLVNTKKSNSVELEDR